jgi:hypothetical protein
MSTGEILAISVIITTLIFIMIENKNKKRVSNIKKGKQSNL